MIDSLKRDVGSPFFGRAVRLPMRRNDSRRIAVKIIDRSITREYTRCAIEHCVTRKGGGSRVESRADGAARA
ncbi:hypothetical protein [Burkholderia sp. RF4-BP95]|uniref:hypothetical protein n=1 Tax=Burkholderia sp. RF4-BP95 TaxID=1637845 RepID=UPI0012E39A7C|nr:hypothetical protein [Burkholderia sp. RF4-BP95]